MSPDECLDHIRGCAFECIKQATWTGNAIPHGICIIPPAVLINWIQFYSVQKPRTCQPGGTGALYTLESPQILTPRRCQLAFSASAEDCLQVTQANSSNSYRTRYFFGMMPHYHLLIQSRSSLPVEQSVRRHDLFRTILPAWCQARVSNSCQIQGARYR